MTGWNRSLPDRGRDGFHAVRDQTLGRTDYREGVLANADASEWPVSPCGNSTPQGLKCDRVAGRREVAPPELWQSFVAVRQRCRACGAAAGRVRERHLRNQRGFYLDIAPQTTQYFDMQENIHISIRLSIMAAAMLLVFGGIESSTAQNFSNHIYQIIYGPLTWNQAKADAEARGGHLATITSQAEAEYIQSLGILPADPFEAFWLGASDEAQEGIWTWVTGEPFAFAA